MAQTQTTGSDSEVDSEDLMEVSSCSSSDQEEFREMFGGTIKQPTLEDIIAKPDYDQLVYDNQPLSLNIVNQMYNLGMGFPDDGWDYESCMIKDQDGKYTGTVDALKWNEIKRLTYFPQIEDEKQRARHDKLYRLQNEHMERKKQRKIQKFKNRRNESEEFAPKKKKKKRKHLQNKSSNSSSDNNNNNKEVEEGNGTGGADTTKSTISSTAYNSSGGNPSFQDKGSLNEQRIIQPSLALQSGEFKSDNLALPESLPQQPKRTEDEEEEEDDAGVSRDAKRKIEHADDEETLEKSNCQHSLELEETKQELAQCYKKLKVYASEVVELRTALREMKKNTQN